ncbi:MAG: hypothetical protein L3J66_05920 [Bacteroidales bacterium]|nr:hypothetical protein [Bacteroidales bacterium]
MKTFARRLQLFYSGIQLLSLDVVAGAMAVGYFAIRLLHPVANPFWWFILPFAVWSFYTLDHLFDGFRLKGEAQIKRHRFHYENRRVLGSFSVFFGLTAFVFSLVFLEKQIIRAGLVAGSLVLLYFLVLSRSGSKNNFLFQKELMIALVYVSGIWLAPLVWYGHLPETVLVLIIFVLFLLAWAEGIMASRFDYENDVHDGHSSFTVLFGKRFTRQFLIILHILIFLLIKLSVFFISTKLQFAALIILAIMNLSLLIITLYPDWFQKYERYRIAGESVFLLPVLIAFF